MELFSKSNVAMHCPSSPSTILKRATSLGCNQKYQYHCLRNKEDEMVEKCLEISWIQKDKCAVYDAGAQTIDEWKCFRNLGICPQTQYLSNDVMSYSACVPSLPPTPPADGKVNTNTATSKPPSDVSDVQPWIWVLAVAVLLAVIVAIVVMCVIINKRRKRSLDSKLHDEEMSPLQSLTESKEDPSREKDRKPYDMVPYYKTKRYEYLETRLLNSSVSIIVVGEPGSGKSILGEMLYIRFCKRKINGKYMARRLKKLEDIDKYPRHNHLKSVYIFDDCFEVWNQYPQLNNQSLEQIKQVHEKVVKSEKNCLVFTISKRNFENNLDAVQRAQLTSTDQLEIVDLSLEDFHLDITDKVGILEYHRKKKGLTARRVDDTALRKETDSVANYVLGNSLTLKFEFPLSCHLYYKHDSFEENQEIFFSMTRKIIGEFVEGLSKGTHEEKYQYCTLMYVVLCGGQIQAWKKQNDTLLKGIAEVSRIDTSELKFNYGCCLITKEEKKNTYEIIHEEITKFLFTMFGERYTGMVIDKCEVDVLMKFMRTEDKSRRNVYRGMGFLVIGNNFYHRFAARLQGINAEMQNHAIFQDPLFRRQFKEEGNETNAEKARSANENEKNN